MCPQLSLQPVYECGYGGCKAPLPPQPASLPSAVQPGFGNVIHWMVVVGVSLLCARECEAGECPYLAQCSKHVLGHCALFLLQVMMKDI